MLLYRSSFLKMLYTYLLPVSLAIIQSQATELLQPTLRCMSDDNKCIMKVGNEILSNHFGGIPSLGLSQLDPMKVDTLNVTQDSGPITIKVQFKNLELIGLSKAKIYHISGFDTNSKKVEIRFKTPLASCISPYKASGRILIIPISGEGDSKLIFENFDVRLKFAAFKIMKDGRLYLQLNRPEMSFETTSGSVNLSHLISLANSFLNLNFGLIVGAVKTPISESLVNVFVSRINEFLMKTPYNELFIQN